MVGRSVAVLEGSHLSVESPPLEDSQVPLGPVKVTERLDALDPSCLLHPVPRTRKGLAREEIRSLKSRLSGTN